MGKRRFFTTAAHPSFIIPDQFYWLEYNTYLQKKNMNLPVLILAIFIEIL